MRWLQAVEKLRAERRPGVLVTLAAVRGHAPRDAGAKMVVADEDSWDSIGGGNVEASAVSRARAMLASGALAPTTFSLDLSDRAPGEHGVQCCGGEVTVLLEPLVVHPAVAIFGVGHVGLELARILARHDLDLHLVDSRSCQLGDDMLAPLADADARVHVHHEAVLPELVLAELPPGTHVLVMTHDHAEDVALLDAALRAGHLGPVGVIGSSAKWARFRKTLVGDGHEPAAVDSVVTPIGLAHLSGKDPATIAVSVAAALLQSFADESTTVPTRREAST
jgi:xanthine dehydrogenase accessory factor